MVVNESENVSAFVPSEDLDKGEQKSSNHLTISDLAKLPLTVTAELGRCTLKIRDILELKPGSFITLNKQAGELADVYVNGVLIGRGEMIVLADTLHVRLIAIEGLEKNEE